MGKKNKRLKKGKRPLLTDKELKELIEVEKKLLSIKKQLEEAKEKADKIKKEKPIILKD